MNDTLVFLIGLVMIGIVLFVGALLRPQDRWYFLAGNGVALLGMFMIYSQAAYGSWDSFCGSNNENVAFMTMSILLIIFGLSLAWYANNWGAVIKHCILSTVVIFGLFLMVGAIFSINDMAGADSTYYTDGDTISEIFYPLSASSKLAEALAGARSILSFILMMLPVAVIGIAAAMIYIADNPTEYMTAIIQAVLIGVVAFIVLWMFELRGISPF